MTDHTLQTSRRSVAGVVLGLVIALTVVLVAFAWPPSGLAPRDLPIAVAGPPSAAQQVATGLERALGPGALDVSTVPSRSAAVAAIDDREVYGAVAMTARGPEMLVASGAGPVVAQSLAQVETQLAQRTGTAPKVTDVVPLPPGDPHGAVFAAGAFPLALGGLVAGVVVAFAVSGRRRRALAVLGVALGAGLALAGVQQYWLDALAGSYWTNAGVYALAIGAIGAAVLGLHHVLGRLGVGLAAVTILLLGNPLSGITSAPELLPPGWSELGRLLPPGAAGTALRSTAYFGGAGAMAPVLVLAAWLVVGLALLAWPVSRSAAASAAGPARRPGSRPVRAA